MKLVIVCVSVCAPQQCPECNRRSSSYLPPGDMQNASSDTDGVSAQEQVKSPLHNNSLVLDRDLEPEIYSTQSQHYLEQEQEVRRTRCYKGHFCEAMFSNRAARRVGLKESEIILHSTKYQMFISLEHVE